MVTITQQYLREVLSYNPDTGIWVWLVNRGRMAKAGQRAGTINGKGYRMIKLDSKLYQSSRLAWLYMKGEWPERDIDHKDTIKSNDKWENLRLATVKQNSYNIKVFSNNRLGVKGITFCKNRYRSRIWADGKCTTLGYFLTLEEAKAVREKAARELHGEFYRE